jgi:putative component of membrane protein insertase Oxa1/YidC/SpoIIIJ protein YidD
MSTMIVVSLLFSTLSCDPFNESGHNNVRNNLRNTLPWMTEKIPSAKY